MEVIFFAFGAVVASFVGVLVARLYTGQSFLAGRSRCDACGAPLASRMLVPVLSYAMVRGRARCCGARLSARAPFAELALGGLFAFAYMRLGLTPVLLTPVLLALSLLLALVLYDLSHQILPPSFLGTFVLSAATAGFLQAPSLDEFYTSTFVALLIALFIALIHFFSRGRAVGFSDAPLVFGLALFTGPAAFAGLVFSFWIGAIVGIVVLARRPRGSRMGVEVPFAPFLAAGFLLAYITQWNPFVLFAVLP